MFSLNFAPKMDLKAVYKICKDLGCCDGCSLRYGGVRIPIAYENIKKYCLRFKPKPNNEEKEDNTPKEDAQTDGQSTQNMDTTTEPPPDSNNGMEVDESNGHADSDSPPGKRRKTEVCVSCLGVLEEEGWPDCNRMVKDMLEKKRYDCGNFACALSAPISTILREKAITLRLKEELPDFELGIVTPLKEAWKWSYANQLATYLDMTLDSGAISPLLITLHMEYPDDLQELEVLKTLSPALFESRSRQRKRFAAQFTRRAVEQALAQATLATMTALEGWGDGLPRATARVSCVSVTCSRAPLYLGGRYIKLSRTLPQTPWLVAGKRMMESSVQEIIFEPLAKMYGLSEADADHRLKFMSAGREDVDVRCLGDGRPFAIEITDPCRELTDEQLQQVCEQISASKQVEVKTLVYVDKDALITLKTGEETKCKTYEALCIKLSNNDPNDKSPPLVTEQDIARINACGALQLAQRTPVRVLHRRPLLVRTRTVQSMHAERVKDHPQLFVLRITTSAGAYVKEFVHGELGRTAPSLAAAGGGRADILALDVAQVHLDWPQLI